MSKIKRTNKGWTATPNELLHSNEISFKAKGIYSYLNSKPTEWNFAIERVARETKEGAESIRAGMKELESFGWLLRKPVKTTEGKFNGYDYFIFDEPKALAEERSTEEPSSGNPSTANYSTLNKKEYNKKELIKKREGEKGNPPAIFKMKTLEYKPNPILTRLLEVLPELKNSELLIFIVRALEKRGEKWEDFLLFVKNNKKTKIKEIGGWENWFWKDFLISSEKISDQKASFTESELKWYKDRDINPYGAGTWQDQYKDSDVMSDEDLEWYKDRDINPYGKGNWSDQYS